LLCLPHFFSLEQLFSILLTQWNPWGVVLGHIVRESGLGCSLDTRIFLNSRVIPVHAEATSHWDLPVTACRSRRSTWTCSGWWVSWAPVHCCKQCSTKKHQWQPGCISRM
jgi:hypothetical protein